MEEQVRKPATVTDELAISDDIISLQDRVRDRTAATRWRCQIIPELVKQSDVDAVQDVSLMAVFSERLAKGRINDNEAAEKSWLLGSTKKRVDPILDLLEDVQRLLGEDAAQQGGDAA